MWEKYQECYEEAINKTSLPHAPWYIIPADNKEAARLLVAKVIQEKMNELEGIKEPELEDEVKAKLGEYREMLSKESND